VNLKKNFPKNLNLKYKMKMNKVTIIIPMYNVQQYIKYLLMDLQKQSYSNIEYILINDGSTDQTGYLVELFINRQEDTVHEYKLFTTNNMGVSAARNLGIENAHGEYIVFVDADDRLDENFVSEYVASIEKSGADIEMFSLYKTKSITNLTPVNRMNYAEIGENGYLNGPEFFINISDFKLKTYISTFIFKKELLKKVKFNTKVKYWEDFLLVCSIITSFPKIVIHVNNQAFYYYYQRSDSALHSMELNDYDQCLMVIDILLTKIKKQNVLQEIYSIFLGFKVGVLKTYIAECIRQSNYLKYKQLKKEFLTLNKKAKYNSKRESIIRRVQYVALRINLPFWILGKLFR